MHTAGHIEHTITERESRMPLMMPPIDYLGAALHIANTYLRAVRLAQGLGLTLDEWKQAVESTSVLIQCGYTHDEIEAAARMHARGKADQ